MCDVVSPGACDTLVAWAEREVGPVTAVIANAGLEVESPVAELSRQASLAVMDDGGLVARGRVDGGLLEAGADLPGGVALDRATVLAEASAAWDEVVRFVGARP